MDNLAITELSEPRHQQSEWISQRPKMAVFPAPSPLNECVYLRMCGVYRDFFTPPHM